MGDAEAEAAEVETVVMVEEAEEAEETVEAQVGAEPKWETKEPEVPRERGCAMKHTCLPCPFRARGGGSCTIMA